ncbi:hypothetical protein ATZ33_07825 [Enterococcus silesiacus]|uniref:CHY-type domain-containing protein n=1 Tax=Enterococcus silesiacus TaxID=332949 RepID=A0ABM5W7Q5_9ENTE|nr:CHY zinc finger protein [Enterococcus silesiacus]ALS01278.1 hypothetical protein ATZ33_07825 [Enterococcus silesiacus]
MEKIHGSVVDNQGRCVHYASAVDVVGNKCFLCKKYYACFQCHDELEAHNFMPWPLVADPGAKIVLCGVCQFEMTADEYKKQSGCLNCGQLFNPNCSKHSAIYFS